MPHLIVTHGMQRRSDAGWVEAIAWDYEGHLGKITLSRGLNYKTRESIGLIKEPRKVPKSIDYNLWCGPRPMAPVMREQFHYDWHWFWDYGNGDIGNQGPHQLDVARWALHQMKMPLRSMSLGARWGCVDNGQTPDNQSMEQGRLSASPAHLGEQGCPTEAAALRELIGSLKAGEKWLTFEEGGMSLWLCEVLRPLVDRLIVCDPREEAR